MQARDVSGGAERVVGLALDGESEGCDAVAGVDTDDDDLPDAVASAAAGDRLCWTFSVLPNRTTPGETRFPIAEECTTRVASLDALLEVLVDGEVMQSVTFKALLPSRVLCLAPDDPRDVDCPEPDPCNVCCGC